MHLKELIDSAEYTSSKSVPDWMIACFKRRSITFANGQIDKQTHVFWLQGRNITIDLRLPIDNELVTQPSWLNCTIEELMTLANYEGWCAESLWQHNQLSWSGGVSFQLHNRWPEPAILSRVGDCMMEFSPKGTYVEDWRIQSKTSGALVSLKLIDETNTTTGMVRHKGGALIINGDWAGLVLGRSVEMELSNNNRQLRDEMINAIDDHHLFEKAFNFETSVATGNVNDGFKVSYSTRPERVNELLFSLEGFDIDRDANEIIQVFMDGDQMIKRRFEIDALEAEFPFSSQTVWDKDAEQWFDFEQGTLGRYLEVL